MTTNAKYYVIIVNAFVALPPRQFEFILKLYFKYEFIKINKSIIKLVWIPYPTLIFSIDYIDVFDKFKNER